MFKDKLFFFGAQEWVNFFAGADQHRHRPDARRCARGDFSELLNPTNGFFSTAPDHQRSADGPAVPGEHHPAGPAVAERHRDHERCTRCRRRASAQGTANAIFSSDNPQDQRKDNIRFDYRLNDKNQFTYRYSKYNWMAVDAFRGTFPFARTDWDRPNATQNVKLDEHASRQP